MFKNISLKNVLSRSRLLFLAVSLSVGAFLAACSGGKGPQSLGKAIPTDVREVTLQQLLSHPDDFNNQKVVIRGHVSGQCASFCEFFLKDGGEAVTIYPQGYKLPKLTIGQKSVVYAEITTGDERVVVSALGVQFE